MSGKRKAPWRNETATPSSRRRVNFTSSTPMQRDAFDYDEEDETGSQNIGGNDSVLAFCPFGADAQNAIDEENEDDDNLSQLSDFMDAGPEIDEGDNLSIASSGDVSDSSDEDIGDLDIEDLEIEECNRGRTGLRPGAPIYMNMMPPADVYYATDEKGTGTYQENAEGTFWTTTPSADAFDRMHCSEPDRIELSDDAAYLEGAKDQRDFFEFVFTQEIIDKILTYTNNYAMAKTEGGWKMLDDVELRAFFGALLYIGERGMTRLSYDEMFGTNCYSIHLPLIRAFGRDRFKAIMRFLRFDDKVARTDDSLQNKIMKIEQIFNDVIVRCRELFVPSKYITVDESMVSYRGRVSFKMYCPAKPDRYGMKIFVLSDAESGAVLNAQLYSGKAGDKAEVGQGARVVRELVEPYCGSGRVVITDRFYTSVGLVEDLWEDGFEFVGTVHPGRVGLPDDFKSINLHKFYYPSSKKQQQTNEDQESDESEDESEGETVQLTQVQLAQIEDVFNRVLNSTNNAATSSASGLRRGAATAAPMSLQAKKKRRIKEFPATMQMVIDTNRPPTTIDYAEPNIRASIDDVLAANPSTAVSPGFRPKLHDAMSAFLHWDKLTAIRYEPKAGKEVFLLTTIHHSDLILDDHEGKPLAILFYNSKKVGVDLLDQLTKYYSTVRASRRWPVRLFLWLLDVATISAQIAYNLANPDLTAHQAERRTFIQQLATRLMKPQMRRREKDKCIRDRIRNLMKVVLAVRKLQRGDSDLGIDESTTMEQTLAMSQTPKKPTSTPRPQRPPPKRPTLPRCYVVSCKKKDRKAYRICKKCGRPVCAEHSDVKDTIDDGKVVRCNIDIKVGVYCNVSTGVSIGVQCNM